MAINSDKPHLWKADIASSVDLFNNWFLNFAPRTYRDSRTETTRHVETALRLTDDLAAITPAVLKRSPGVLPTLRMATCPPIARDRLVGLAYVTKSLVEAMEGGKLPPRMPGDVLDDNLVKICNTLNRLLDTDLFPWLDAKQPPTEQERYRASTIVADRLCGAVSDPIIRNAQEKRQLALIGEYLQQKGYRPKPHSVGRPLIDMEPGTFAFRMTVVTGESRKVNIPIDVVIQARRPGPSRIPVLIEAKSAGDFTNVNKRRKEEAKKIQQLRQTYGPTTPFVLFLCGYFDTGYLGYEAAEGIDWVWEHRIADLDQLGI